MRPAVQSASWRAAPEGMCPPCSALQTVEAVTAHMQMHAPNRAIGALHATRPAPHGALRSQTDHPAAPACTTPQPPSSASARTPRRPPVPLLSAKAAAGAARQGSGSSVGGLARGDGGDGSESMSVQGSDDLSSLAGEDEWDRQEGDNVRVRARSEWLGQPRQDVAALGRGWEQRALAAPRFGKLSRDPAMLLAGRHSHAAPKHHRAGRP